MGFWGGVAASDTGVIETWREVAGTAVMFLYVGDIGDKFFYRRYTSSAWTAWREVLNANQGAVDGDILVRVSGACYNQASHNFQSVPALASDRITQ